MDGTRANRVVKGLLDRPPTSEVISRDYPDVVIGIISGRYTISSVQASPSDHKNITVYLPRAREQHFVLREEDFLICKQVALLFSQNVHGRVPIFLSEPISDLKKRILAYLWVEFAKRG